jgi:hypothetical protein
VSANLVKINPEYFQHIIHWKGYECVPTKGNGGLYKISGFDSYNKMLEINEIFSSQPRHFPVDRTLNISPPLKIKIRRPWQTPTIQLSLSEALEQRVKSIEQQWPNKKINVFWSGGVDSTAVVTAFLSNLSDHSQLRILYSPYSYYEHPAYLDFLKKFTQVELIDISGPIYLNTQFDGMFVTGDSGDETHASLDQSFFETFGFEVLQKSWHDFFYAQNPNSNFIEFCEQYFSRSGIPIHTVLEARWWFYINSKLNCMLFNKFPFWLDYPNFNFNQVQGFFDCAEFESYIAYNINSIMPNRDYKSWKTPLKDYCYQFDSINDWHQNKKKVNSSQLNFYIDKKTILKNLQYIYILEDGTRIHTANLPWVSKQEFNNKYSTTLDYLWNEPDKF